jgi:hypothetical protein
MLASKTRIPVVATALLALLVWLPAGASAQVDPGKALTVARATSHASVEIINTNSRDVEVYAVEETGRRYRLGFVSPGQTSTLQLPDHLIDATTPFRIKVYSFEHTARSALVDYFEGVKTRVLTASAGKKFTLRLADPLSKSALIP